MLENYSGLVVGLNLIVFDILAICFKLEMFCALICVLGVQVFGQCT